MSAASALYLFFISSEQVRFIFVYISASSALYGRY
jgi:hypothetical protein